MVVYCIRLFAHENDPDIDDDTAMEVTNLPTGNYFTLCHAVANIVVSSQYLTTKLAPLNSPSGFYCGSFSFIAC